MTTLNISFNSGDISELNALSGFLADGLILGPGSLPGAAPEVLLALSEARDQMKSLPEVIADLNRALDSYLTVSTALGRMIELADQAAGAGLDDHSRAALNGEFVNLAKIVAADAGRLNYAGPVLNLLTQVQAQSAARIIRYMEPVIAETGRGLEEQKALIEEVIAETVKFLEVVIDCYPQSQGALALAALVDEALDFQSLPAASVSVRH